MLNMNFDVDENRGVPPSFSVRIEKTGWRTFRLSASQVVSVPQAEAFAFFEDPCNLFSITPPWLDFRMVDPERSSVFEGAEYDYMIRWLGIRMRWRSRIVDYVPPERFTDIQLIGPYQSWTHRHVLRPDGSGTSMDDEVIYTIPVHALPFHRLVIMPQLIDIFTYRAVMIDAWARKHSRARFVPEVQ